MLGLGAAQGTQAQWYSLAVLRGLAALTPLCPSRWSPSPPSHPLTPAFRSSSPSPFRVVPPLLSQSGTPAPSRWQPFPTLSGGQQALATLALTLLPPSHPCTIQVAALPNTLWGAAGAGHTGAGIRNAVGVPVAFLLL